MLVSLIVPVYNSAEYLENCLKSLLGQTFIKTDPGKLEILLVDNGSADNSPEIINRYAAKYPKLIRSLVCTEKGAGAARNFGVSHAKGKYFWFIDADDYIADSAVEKLFDLAKQEASDFIMLTMQYVYPDGSLGKVLPIIDAKSPDAKQHLARYGAGPCQFFMRRDFWTEHQFAFKTNIIHEDMELTPSFAIFVEKFSSIKEPLYFYIQHENSVLHKTTWDGKYFDIFPALEGLYQRFKSAKALKEYHDELEYFFIWNLLVDSAEDFKKFKEGRPGFKRSRTMLKKYFPHWRRNKYLKQKPLTYRIRRRLAYHGFVI